jgi:MFS family permease
MGLALLVCAFAITPFVHTILTFAIVMTLFSLGGAFANNGINALISVAATDREQGTVLGVGSSLDSLAGIVAPPVSTGVLTIYGSAYAGMASLIMAIIGFILGLRNSAALPAVVSEVANEASLSPAEEAVS